MLVQQQKLRKQQIILIDLDGVKVDGKSIMVILGAVYANLITTTTEGKDERKKLDV